MNALALNIQNILVRQDSEGRYSLNDLHKASGNEAKHRPNYFLDIQQTKDLITEIETTAGISALEQKQAVKVVNGGNKKGTYAVKELVYAYAMWISPAFTLKVIHAYDSLVSVQYGLKQLPEQKTKKALPGCLTLEQQDTIKALVKANAEKLPKEKQAGATVKQWAAIKKKFGCSYKEVSPDNFVNIISLISRLPLEGELLDKEPDPFLADHNYRNEAREAINAHLDACHAEMVQAGLKAPAWPTMSEQTITGLAASLLWHSRWLLSFNPDNMKPYLIPMSPHDCVVDSSNPERIKSFINSLSMDKLHDVTDVVFNRVSRQINRENINKG